MIDENDNMITFPNVNNEKMMNTNVCIHSTYHYYNDNNSKNSNIYNYYYYDDFDFDRNDLLHTIVASIVKTTDCDITKML